MSTASQLPDDPIHEEDPRWAYAEMDKDRTYAGWPCGECGIRRDEHADQDVQSGVPSLDITDHSFVEKFTLVEGATEEAT